MTQTTGFVIPFMPCLQSTYRYRNKRASSKLQQAVLWKLNLIKSHCQISGLGCSQSILPLQIVLLRHWCPLQPRTYVRVDSRLSLAGTLNTGTDCVENYLRLGLSNTTQHCSYVHPFKHTLLINMWWVIPHFWWTNKVLYVIWLHKEQNDYYYIIICALVL
jgi:hypothetical protein